MNNIEKLISWYGSNGYAVGSSLTWADLFIFDISHDITSKIPEAASKYPLANKIIENVSEIERIKNYVATRPVTEF
jgi:hypothetical protein